MGVRAGILLVGVLVGIVCALDNGAVLTPPMGWLAWERYRCDIDCVNDPDNCISEKLFMTMGQLLVKLGLRDVGYNYVNIDDCWQQMSRDPSGSLVGDPVRFPHGIRWLADQMHNMNLKLGIYEDYGTLTCGGYPGSYGYLDIDAKTFANWTVDSLKLDGCYAEENQYAIGYPQMTRALNATGRQIIYSCSWPAYVDFDKVPWKDVAENCNLWRLYDDIEDSWSSVYSIIQYWAKHQDVLAPLAAPGQWNDPDMLIIGDFSLSYTESQAQMAIWAIIAAPLYMSNDLRTISSDALKILLNKEVIAVDQDPLGIQGKRVWAQDDLEVWSRPLLGGSVAVVCFNGRDDGMPMSMTFNFTQVGLAAHKASFRDLFAGKDLGVHAAPFTCTANPHGVVMYKITPVP